jgi:hypothetical protein
MEKEIESRVKKLEETSFQLMKENFDISRRWKNIETVIKGIIKKLTDLLIKTKKKK